MVVRRLREPGDVLVPGGTVLEIASTEQIWTSAWVDESEINKLAVCQQARIVFRSDPNNSYPGTVARLGQETDRETREFPIDVTARELPQNWTLGQRAEVYVEAAHKHDAIAIPSSMVKWRDGRAGVLVDAVGKAKWQPVTLGLRGREVVEVVSGMTVGQRVVAPTDPLVNLRDGRAIRINPVVP